MAPAQDRERRVNFDGRWGAEDRWYRLGDVSLGRRGVKQIVVFYVLAGVPLSYALHVLPVVGALTAAHLPAVVWSLGPIVLSGALGVVKPNGLAMHVFLPIALGQVFAERHLLGWTPCAEPVGRWSPRPLALESDGSESAFTEMEYVGPGELIRHRAARRTKAPRSLLDRLRGRPATQDLVQTGAWLPEPKLLTVKAGQRIRIHEEDRR